jgi:hypothetical protein
VRGRVGSFPEHLGVATHHFNTTNPMLARRDDEHVAAFELRLAPQIRLAEKWLEGLEDRYDYGCLRHDLAWRIYRASRRARANGRRLLFSTAAPEKWVRRTVRRVHAKMWRERRRRMALARNELRLRVHATRRRIGRADRTERLRTFKRQHASLASRSGRGSPPGDSPSALPGEAQTPPPVEAPDRASHTSRRGPTSCPAANGPCPKPEWW